MSRTKREIGETPAKEGAASPFTDKRKFTVLVKSTKHEEYNVFILALCLNTPE